MVAKTRQSLAQPDVQFGNETSIAPSARQKLDRVTQSVRALVAEVQRLQQLMAGGQANQVLTKTGSGDYEGTWGTSGSAATLTALKNVGAGEPIYAGLDGTVAKIRTLVPGANITLSLSADSITISSAGAGTPGSGTVTSVAIDSNDLVVSGSPITDHGIIELEIRENKVTYDKIQLTSQDSIFIGRRAGEGAGQVEELTAVDALTILGLSTTSGYPAQLGYAGIV